MTSEKRVVILAGGRGTRLRPYTVTLPKPLVPIGERPILEIVLGQLRRAGFARATLAVSNHVPLIQAYFGDGARWGMRIDYSLEQEPLGTIGPLRLIPDLDGSFLVMNGDVLTDLDLGAFLDAHRASGALVSVAAAQRELASDFGVLEVDERWRLLAFREKPRVTQLVSMGIYALDARACAHIPQAGAFGVDQLLVKLIDAGAPVRVAPHAGYWLDIGKPEDYQRAQDDAAVPLGLAAQ